MANNTSAQEKDIRIKKRYIHLNGFIDEGKSENFISQLFTLESEDPTRDILILIDSYGGLVDSMWSMIDAMNLSRCNINTLVFGKAMSAAALVLMNGTKGKRYATPNCRIMLHQISNCYSGKYSDLDNELKEMSRMHKSFLDFIKKQTKIESIKKVEEILETETYLTAEDGIKLGIVDKIINNFSQLKMKDW